MNKKVKKYMPMALSFAVVIIAAVLLAVLISVYSSKKSHLIHSFDDKITVENGILVGNENAYLYNEYGGSIAESEIAAIPLSQYGGPDDDYLFYTFDSQFFGVNDGLFNGGNSTQLFLCKVDGVLYLVDTYQRECTAIKPDVEFYSASTHGTYLLELENNECNFYKRLNSKYELSDGVKMQVDSQLVEPCFWLNDRYILVRADYQYLIADAENGETISCTSLNGDIEETDTELISKRYFNVSSTETIALFDIYTQDNVEFKYDNSENISVISVSDNASYAVICDTNVLVISADGKSLAMSDIIEGEFISAEFIADNILLITEKQNDKVFSSIYKIIL